MCRVRQRLPITWRILSRFGHSRPNKNQFFASPFACNVKIMIYHAVLCSCAPQLGLFLYLSASGRLGEVLFSAEPFVQFASSFWSYFDPGGRPLVSLLRLGCLARRVLSASPPPPPPPPPLQIYTHTYKQHKVQRRIGDAPGPPTIRPGVSATSMTLFAQQHN